MRKRGVSRDAEGTWGVGDLAALPKPCSAGCCSRKDHEAPAKQSPETSRCSSESPALCSAGTFLITPAGLPRSRARPPRSRHSAERPCGRGSIACSAHAATPPESQACWVPPVRPFPSSGLMEGTGCPCPTALPHSPITGIPQTPVSWMLLNHHGYDIPPVVSGQFCWRGLRHPLKAGACGCPALGTELQGKGRVFFGGEVTKMM